MTKYDLYRLIVKDIIVRAAQEGDPALLERLLANEDAWRRSIESGVDTLLAYEDEMGEEFTNL